jgi:hypothetical protein
MCPEGECATSTRTCSTATYEVLDEPYYMISNSRWPDHFMDMGEVSGAGITGGFPEDDAHKFHLRVVTPTAGSGLYVILSSKKWPTYSLSVHPAEDGDLKDQQYVNAEDISDDDVGVMEASVELLIPPVPRPDPENAAVSSFVMIMGAEHPNYFNVHTTSWTVFATEADEGAGSYWYIHPALPDELLSQMHAYGGTPCELNCGEAQPALAPGGWTSYDANHARSTFQSGSAAAIALLLAVLGFSWM